MPTYNSQDFDIYWAEEGQFGLNPSISTTVTTNITTDVALNTITRADSGGSWIADGFGIGQSIDLAGVASSATATLITALTATVMTVVSVTGSNDSGVTATVKTNIAWTPFIEVQSMSGRGTTQEVIQAKRIGTRQRAGSPRGKIEEDTLSIECNLTNAVQVASVDADVMAAFLCKDSATTETIDTSSVNVTFAEANPDTIVRASGDWTTNFSVGDRINIEGSTSNDGTYIIDTVVALTITLSNYDDLAAEAMTSGNLVITKVYAFDHSYNKSVTVSGNLPISYTILAKETSNAVYEYYRGCVLSEVEFSVEEGSIIMVTLNFERIGSDLGAVEAGGDDSYGTYPTTITYTLWSDATVTKQNNDALDGWTNAEQLLNVSSLSFTVSQNAEKKFRVSGSREAESIDLVGFEVSGSMDFDYNDLNEYDEISGDKRGDLLVDLGSATGKIILEDVTYEGFPMDASPDELMTASVDISADTATFAK